MNGSRTTLRIPQLTFDDGPSEWTPAILDLLAEHKQRAAFFVTGEHLLDWWHLLPGMKAQGHIIGVHGFTHRRLTDLGDNEVVQELIRTMDLLEAHARVRAKFFRAPFFATDGRVNAIAAGLGLAHVGADIVPDDWMASDPEAVAAAVLSELAPGKVVCLHDGVPPGGGSTHCTPSRDITVAALALILAGMPVAA